MSRPDAAFWRDKAAAAQSLIEAEAITVYRCDSDDPWAEVYAGQRRDAHHAMQAAHLAVAVHYRDAAADEARHEAEPCRVVGLHVNPGLHRDAGAMTRGWLGALAVSLLMWAGIVLAVVRVTA